MLLELVCFWQVTLGESHRSGELYVMEREVTNGATRAFCNGALIRLDGGASLVSKI